MTELLRAIQFFNSLGYHLAPGAEDGFLPGPGPDDGADFEWRQLEASPGDVRQIKLCDLDSDDSPDVLVSSEEGGLEWWAYAGVSGFTRHVVHGPVEDVAIIDLDGDGDADVLGPHDPDSGTLWLENDGQGGFTARSLTTSDICAGVTADFDGDGRMDIAMRRVVRTLHGATGTWWRNDGALAFTRFDFSLDPLGESDAEEWRFTRALDFTGNLRADLAGKYTDAEGFSVLFLCRNVGDTEFVCQDLTLATNSIGFAPPVDFDGNGHADIVATLAHDDDQGWQRCPWPGLGCYFSWDETIVFENDGDGGFTERRLRLRCGTDATFYPLWTTDIDADGDVDIFISAVHRWSPGDRSFGWWEQQPEGAWVTHYIGSVHLDPATSCVSDFNGDGFPDIFGVNAGGALGWWENQLGK